MGEAPPREAHRDEGQDSRGALVVAGCGSTRCRHFARRLLGKLGMTVMGLFSGTMMQKREQRADTGAAATESLIPNPGGSLRNGQS